MYTLYLIVLWKFFIELFSSQLQTLVEEKPTDEHNVISGELDNYFVTVRKNKAAASVSTKPGNSSSVTRTRKLNAVSSNAVLIDPCITDTLTQYDNLDEKLDDKAVDKLNRCFIQKENILPKFGDSLRAKNCASTPTRKVASVKPNVHVFSNQCRSEIPSSIDSPDSSVYFSPLSTPSNFKKRSHEEGFLEDRSFDSFSTDLGGFGTNKYEQGWVFIAMCWL